jgi:hypothetical protein
VLVVLILVVVDVVLPVLELVGLDVVADVLAADVLVVVPLLVAALVVDMLVLAAVVTLVAALLEPVELVVVAGAAAPLALVVPPVAALVGRIIRSSRTSTSVGRLALVALVVELAVPAAVLAVRTVPLGVGWGRTLMKTTTLPAGLMFMKLPSSARKAPGPADETALALRRMVVALLVVALPVVPLLVVAALVLAPAVALVTVPAAMTSPDAEEKVPCH